MVMTVVVMMFIEMVKVIYHDGESGIVTLHHLLDGINDLRTVITLFLHYSYTIVTLLSHYFDTVVTLLLP
jgi:hypothetical protein